MHIHVSERDRTPIKELLDQIDIEWYLDREGIRYKSTRGSSGPQLNLKECPFCGSRKWKVYIGQETGLGNCFSGDCSQGTFNKYQFIKANLGSGSTELMRHIKTVAAEQGWKPKRITTPVAVDESGLTLPESVSLPFHGKNLAYLDRRGITSDIASYFHLRYSKNGVFRYHDGDKERFQDYSSRVIVPVYDLEGALVSFQGRDMTDEAESKYLFPPGYSSTGKYLYNGQNAVGSKRVLICEGVFDVFAAAIALGEEIDLRDVAPIGSFGKSLSNGFENDQVEQLIRLKRSGLKEVTFMWDGERLATQAAIKSALVVSALGLTARVALLPKGKDPNEVPGYIVTEAYRAAVVINRLSAIKLLSNLSRY